MAGAKQRNKALKRRRHRVNPDDLAPGIAAGLTQGASAAEAAEMFPEHKAVSGAELVSHMHRADDRITRSGEVPWAPFVIADSFDAAWHDGQTDRMQRDVHKTYTKQGLGLLREGRQCLRCDEPQPVPFPEACDLCGYSMRERQVMDIAMEFAGEKHLGPSAPISDYLEQQEERMEKRKFIDKVLEGGSGKIPEEWLRDATLIGG